MNLRRSQLFELVWRASTPQVARALNIGETSVLAVCRKFLVPTPPRGHWRKVEVGQKVEPAALPAWKDSAEHDPEVGIVVDEQTLGRLLDGEQAPMVPLEPSGSAGASRTPSQRTGSVEESPRLDAAGAPPQQHHAQNMALEEIMELASRLGQQENAAHFLAELRNAAAHCEPATASVIMLLVQEGRDALAHSNPVREMIDLCGKIAHGAARPRWWTALGVKPISPAPTDQGGADKR